MVETRYQIVLLGDNGGLKLSLRGQLEASLSELGLDPGCITFIDPLNVSSLFKSNAPATCVFFADSISVGDIKAVQHLSSEECPIIPVVSDLTKFAELVPEVLRPLNGFELNARNELSKVPALASRVLEGLSLLRAVRKLFMSYRR